MRDMNVVNEDILKDRLSTFTVPEPNAARKRLLVERMKVELSTERETLESVDLAPQGWFAMIRTQLGLFSAGYWVGLAVLYAVVVTVLFIWPTMYDSAQQAWRNFPPTFGIHPFYLFMPLISASGVIYALRAVGTPMFELEMSLPASFAQLLFSRLFIVTITNIIVGLAVSYPLAIAFDMSVAAFVFSWLVPLLFYCALSMLCLTRFGVWAGSIWTALLWLIPLALHRKLDLLNLFSQPGEVNWMESKLITVFVTAILVLLTVLTIKQQKMITKQEGHQ